MSGLLRSYGLTLGIPQGFNEDDEALTADLAAFWDARRIPMSAIGGRVGSDSTQDEVISGQLRGIDTEEEGEEVEEEPELPVVGDYERGESRICRTIASMKGDSGGFVFFHILY
jgi:hypothetical protein